MTGRWSPWRASAWEARAEASIGRLLRRRRGWQPTPVVYPSYGRAGGGSGSGWIRLVGRVLLRPPDLTTTSDGRSRGWRRYVTIAEPGTPVTVAVGDRRVGMVASHGGYLDERVVIDLPPGRHEVRVATAASTVGSGTVTVIDPASTRRGVVSDIDDTVVITAMPRPIVAFWNTFVLREGARQAVPGMVAFLDKVSDGFVVYLSTGAWNYAPVIRDFLLRAGYPDGSLLMTDWGPSAGRWFRSGVAHKQSALRRLRAEFPELTWTLVGDDGQHDPAIYDDFAAEHPGVVDTIAIRQLSATQQVLTHGTPAAPDESRLSRPRTPSSNVHRIMGPDGRALLARLADD